jgi:SAM-dependent methyltransferase
MTTSSTQQNRDFYNSLPEGSYRCGAPHLRHESVFLLYMSLVERAHEIARGRSPDCVTVLDLGAGDGIATLPFLQLGAQVLAVDISENQLQQLARTCDRFSARLELRCADILRVLEEDRRFDIVVANSLLHHIPDYTDLVRRASTALAEGGVFFSFQDPMWKPSMSQRDAVLSWAAYVFWRLGQGDLARGAWRRIRRSFGIYSSRSPHDNVEYHAVRRGVNQALLVDILTEEGFHCDVFEYCSFHSSLLQPWGEKLGVRNTYGLLAARHRLA